MSTIIFQLTPSRRATPPLNIFLYPRVNISTHALTEGDGRSRFCTAILRISTHALTEGDSATFTFPAHSRSFQLTPSRRATIQSPTRKLCSTFQLTPSRRATRIPYGFFHLPYFNSRPHGGRRWRTNFSKLYVSFQLTPSRRATASGYTYYGAYIISTHALTEGDSSACLGCSGNSLFQLTPSRRATAQGR